LAAGFGRRFIVITSALDIPGHNQSEFDDAKTALRSTYCDNMPLFA